MAEYTKGEWKASYQFPHTVYATDGKRPPTTIPIATMTAPDQVEMEANAHLIAAAPDLYVACKEAFNLLIDLRELIINHPVYLEKAKNADSKLWKAITKAEGK